MSGGNWFVLTAAMKLLWPDETHSIGRTFSGIWMVERRSAHRYKLPIPIVVWGPELERHLGIVRDISPRGIYLLVDQACQEGAELEFLLRLPAELTGWNELIISARGKAVRVETKREDGTERVGIAAVLNDYDVTETNPAAGRHSCSTAA